MTKIVGVHGVGNYRPTNSGQTLSAIWTAALADAFGPQGPNVQVTVAYYAPALRPQSSQGADDDPDQLGPGIQRMIRNWLIELGAPTEVAQGRGTAPIRHALEWVAARFGLDNRLVRIFTTIFFREIATYLDSPDSPQRARARQAVIDTIAETNPRVVIAHSLGSVVTYEALHTRPDLSVDLLLTLGSPLGMPDVVYNRLQPPTISGQSQRPPGVSNWINLADPGDLIAIPRRLSSRFHGIQADLEPVIHAFDFHKVKNYLANPTTGAALAPYLSR